MDSHDRRSLKGLTLDELKRSTTTSSPPATFVRERTISPRSEQYFASELHAERTSTSLSPSPLRTSTTNRTPPTGHFTFFGSSANKSPSPLSLLVNFGTFSTTTNTFQFTHPSMVREQEPPRTPLVPSAANAQPTLKIMDSQDLKTSASPRSDTNRMSDQSFPSPQPLFGRPTQLGASTQPFARRPLFQPSSSGTSQRQPGSGERGSDGNNHLFISNKSGNRRPDYHRPQANSNPLQSLHRPPSGSNPLSQVNITTQKPKPANIQNDSAAARPRNTRIIDSSDDDDDVFEVPKPTTVPAWQSKPYVPPTFSSAHSSNPYFQPQPPTATFMTKSALVANTVADGGIWDDRYNSADPSIYLDSGKAQEELKALFEGSVDDDDDKSKPRRKKEKTDAKAGDLADQMKSLDVQSAQQAPERDDEDDAEEEDEDDGTVDGLKVKLLPHQVEGVEWMTTKERGRGKSKKGITKGGILADDMGLGKTIQSISLMLINQPPDVMVVRDDSEVKYDRCTLIVAPLALIKQWEGELHDRVEPSHRFKVCVHHGPQRSKSFKELRKNDIVITTYQTLSSEHAACSERIRAGCFGVNWYRVILDEAHSIKNRSAKVTKAACALEAKNRWCLTGTPMQNNLDELQSLIAFLRIGPLDKYDYWKSRIMQPINSGRGGLAIRRLQAALKGIMKRRTKDVLKQNAATSTDETTGEKQGTKGPGFKIVKRTVEKVEAEFTGEEGAFYQRLESRIDDKLEKMAASGAKVNYANALVLLLRLRQACNHAKLLGHDLAGERDALGDSGLQTPRKKPIGADMDDLTTMLGGLNVEMKECDICQVELSQREVADGSIRCQACEADLIDQVKVSKTKQQKKKEMKMIVKNDRKVKRRVIIDSDDEDDGEDDRQDSLQTKAVSLVYSSSDEEEYAEQDEESVDSDDDNDDDDDDSSSRSQPVPSIVASTKIRHLLSILRNDSHTHKYIVFSFFTSMLDLIEPFMKQHHIKFARYDGSMPNHAREASLASLRNDRTTRVLLCSLRAGSLGLNLTAASRVVVLEPFWNPFVEEQAIDRVHRLNQTQDVVVYKLTIKDTVEARILELQERKRELARVTVEGGAGAGKNGVAKLTLAEMMKLFEHSAEQGAGVDLVGMKGEGTGLLDRSRERGESTAADDHHGDGIVDVLYNRGKTGAGVNMGSKGNVARKEHSVYGRRW